MYTLIVIRSLLTIPYVPRQVYLWWRQRNLRLSKFLNGGKIQNVVSRYNFQISFTKKSSLVLVAKVTCQLITQTRKEQGGKMKGIFNCIFVAFWWGVLEGEVAFSACKTCQLFERWLVEMNVHSNAIPLRNTSQCNITKEWSFYHPKAISKWL